MRLYGSDAARHLFLSSPLIGGRIIDCLTIRGPAGFHIPYVQAYVKLDDGPVIYGNVIGVSPDDSRLQPGTEVEMEIGVVKTLDEVDWIGWSFRPVDTRE